MSSRDPKEQGPKPDFPEAKEQEHPGMQHKMSPAPDWGLKSYKGYGRLQGKKALITGADSGIGSAVALAFAREGADVAIQYLPVEQKDAEAVAQAVKAEGKQCHLFPYDFNDESSYEKLINDTVKVFGRIDLLILNAAFQGKALTKFTDMTMERVKQAFNVNIISMFGLAKYAIPHMHPGSAVVTTSSIQAYQPSNPILDYATTKGAIVAFTKGLAKELIDKGIRVNSVAPGPVWTPLVQASFDEQKLKEFGKSYPIKRPAQPVELAPSYVFLCSQESTYINGEILAVTGGEPTA